MILLYSSNSQLKVNMLKIIRPQNTTTEIWIMGCVIINSETHTHTQRSSWSKVMYYEKDDHHPHTGSVWWLPMKAKSQLNSKKKRKTPTVSEFESKLSQTFGHKSLLSADKHVTWVENVWPFTWLKFLLWVWLIKLRSVLEQHTQMVSGTKRVVKVKQKLCQFRQNYIVGGEFMNYFRKKKRLQVSATVRDHFVKNKFTSQSLGLLRFVILHKSI